MRMSFVVSSIAEVNKIALWIRVSADDWTTERAIITSNVKWRVNLSLDGVLVLT